MSSPVPTTGSPAGTTVTGRVAVDDDGALFVDVPRRSACQSCGKDSACGMSVLGGLAGTAGFVRMDLKDGTAQSGDTVTLSCPQDGLLKAAVIAYAPPALGLVGGAVTAALNGGGDGVQALGALGGLVLGLMITRWAAAKSRLPAMTILKGANS